MTGRARARARGRARGGVTEKDDRRPGGPPESKQEVRSVVCVVMILHACECSFILELVSIQRFTHPTQSVPSSRYLPSDLHRCFLCNILLISSHGRTKKGVSR